MKELPKNTQELKEALNERIRWAVEAAPDSVLAMIEPKAVDADFALRQWTVEYRVEPWMRNPFGTMHGGIIATVFDNAMGILVRACTGREQCPTIDLSVSFMRPVSVESMLRVTARITSETKSLVHIYAQAQELGAEHICATATATFFLKRA